MASAPELQRYREAKLLQFAHAKRKLSVFTKASWPVLEPTTELKWSWHHGLICEYLTACALGEIRRLIINIAPRTTKSTITTINFPTWLWIADPSLRFLCGSYADKLAVKHSMMRRRLIESDWFQEGYGHRFKLAEDINTKAEFANDKTGIMRAGGINSPPTGEGADFILIDDPHNPKGAKSVQEREKACENFDLGWSNRLNDKKKGCIIVIMQRLHEADLSGHLLEKEQGYVHVKVPTEAPEKTYVHFPISKRVVIREQGDLLQPGRDGPAEIAQAKIDMGPYGYSGQHQQEPTPLTGGVFKTTMFQEVNELPREFDYSFIMADTAYDEKKENDFTVFTCFGMFNDELYIRAVYRKQIMADRVEGEVTPFIERFSLYGFRGCYIEPKGHGIYLHGAFAKKGILVPRDEERDEFFKDRKWDKVARANNAVPHLAHRTIKYHKDLPDKEELISEALRFPKAVHDDFVDTLVDGVKLAFAKSPGSLDVDL